MGLFPSKDGKSRYVRETLAGFSGIRSLLGFF